MQLPSFEYQPKNGKLGDVFSSTNWKCPEEVTLSMEYSFWEVKGIQMKKAWRTCKQPCHVALSLKLLHPHALSMHIIAFSKRLVIFSTQFQMHTNVVLPSDVSRFFVLRQRRHRVLCFCIQHPYSFRFCLKAKCLVAAVVEPSGREICLSLTTQLHLAGTLFDHCHCSISVHLVKNRNN